MMSIRSNCCDCHGGSDNNIVCIDCRDDFEISLTLLDADGSHISIPEGDFRINFSTRGDSFYPAGRAGGALLNCRIDGPGLIVVFDNHHLPPGRLRADFSLNIPNPDFPDGSQSIHRSCTLDVRLTSPSADSVYPVSAHASVILPFIKPSDGASDVDLSQYPTRSEMLSEIDRAVASIEFPPTPDLSDFATKDEIPVIPDFKTVNGESVVGQGNIEIQASGSSLSQWQEDYLKRQESAERLGKLSVSLSVSPSGSEFTGSPLAITLSVAARYDGSEVPVSVKGTSPNTSSLTFSDGKANSLLNPPAVSQGNFSASFSISADYDDGFGVLSKSASASLSRYAPIRLVTVPQSELPTQEQILQGEKIVKSSHSGELSVSFDQGDYVWLCFPAFMNPSKFTSGGFAVPVEPAQPQSVRIGQSSVSYKCIRVSGAPKTSPMKINIS